MAKYVMIVYLEFSVRQCSEKGEPPYDKRGLLPVFGNYYI